MLVALLISENLLKRLAGCLKSKSSLLRQFSGLESHKWVDTFHVRNYFQLSQRKFFSHTSYLAASEEAIYSTSIIVWKILDCSMFLRARVKTKPNIFSNPCLPKNKSQYRYVNSSLSLNKLAHIFSHSSKILEDVLLDI